MMEGYTSFTLNEKIEILKQLKVWYKMTEEEKEEFLNCANEYYADRLMRSFRSKYLM